jgi:hypothetical protein
MKIKIIKPALALLLSTLTLAVTGCWTSPKELAAPTGNPSLVGSMVVVETTKLTATVESVDPATRQVVLKREDGVTTTIKAGANVVNFDQIKAGDQVKAVATGEYAIFLVANGPPPSAGEGVVVTGAAKGKVPAGTLLATQDFTARVIKVDRSYRLLTLEYADGKTRTFKVPMPFTLEHVTEGDSVIVRTTVQVALRLKKHESSGPQS